MNIQLIVLRAFHIGAADFWAGGASNARSTVKVTNEPALTCLVPW